MKAFEFYSKAENDASFRAEQIQEARYVKKLMLLLAIVGGSGWLAYVVYCGVAQHRWAGDLGIGLFLLLCAWQHGEARARLGALEVMQTKQPNQPAAPIQG